MRLFHFQKEKLASLLHQEAESLPLGDEVWAVTRGRGACLVAELPGSPRFAHIGGPLPGSSPDV